MSDGSSSDAHPKGSDPSRPAATDKRKSRKSDVGRALRTVYDDTLREAIPDDFLNLLGKLD